MRQKPTPPPAPAFPLLTLDGLFALLVRPFANPLFSLLPPLVVLSLNPDPTATSFWYSCVFAVASVILQFLWQADQRLAGGPKRHLDWDREVVLITGGAGGLGQALAEYYGSIQRCSTAVVDVLPATEQRCNEWEAIGCQYFQCDIGDSDSVKKLRRDVERDLGTVSVLINAAGIVLSKTALDLSQEDLERSLKVNLLGPIQCIKTFLPGMLGTDGNDVSNDLLAPSAGTIVTVSSVLGYLGAAGLADYTASKAALTTFHASLKAELALSSPKNRVNMILATPGQLSTPLFKHVKPPPLATFLGPTVTPAALAADIIGAVEAGVDCELSTPLYAKWIGVLKVLPPGVAQLARKMAGLDEAGWNAAIAKR